jgi:YYY domain-containing protein
LTTGNLNHHRERKRQPRTGAVPGWIWDSLIILVLLIAATLRLTGIQWDGSHHLHPDERFLTMVETSISPVESLKEYFDTSSSSLNPNNRGFTFYVYGTLPLIITRYVGEWVGMTGYDEINVVGRVLSGVFDLGTVLMIYLIAKRLYRQARIGLLAALFSALAVLQIQLSHYFTVDNFANFFSYAAIYVAVVIATGKPKSEPTHEPITETSTVSRTWWNSGWNSVGLYILFGVLYGAALASKVSMYALAALLPLAALLYYWKLPAEQKKVSLPYLVRDVVIAGIFAFLAFRVFQPYTFQGPGFFGLKLNPGWLSSLRELAVIQSGEVDVPYALQWARRPLTFTVKNLALYGLGLPLGILSLSGLVWMTWRIFKGDWQKHLLIWGWTVFTLVTQSLAHVKSMRYVIAIYPALALIAAWTIFKLFESGAEQSPRIRLFKFNWRRVLAITALLVSVAGTALWAFAFTSIYTKPVTRVAASEWIYENIPAAVNLPVITGDGVAYNQPAAYQNGALISSDHPYRYAFTAASDMQLDAVNIAHVKNQASTATQASLITSLFERSDDGLSYLGGGFLQADFIPVSDSNGDAVNLILQLPIELQAGHQYEVEFAVVEPEVYLRIAGAVSLTGSGNKLYLPDPVFKLTEQTPFQLLVFPRASGTLKEIQLNRVIDLMAVGDSSTLNIALVDSNRQDVILARGSVSSDFAADSDPRGEPITIQLDRAVPLKANTGYYFFFTVEGNAELGIYNSVTVVESTWDDALPVNLYGYNIFGFQDGLFGNNLNLELYWDDNEAKLERITSTLERADAIFISSSRQWGSIPRIAERYPLTAEYYRALIGCPSIEEIEWCYAVAEPGMFHGELGYDLAAVFQNDPQLGKFRVNTQFAEEAFTVYDHPKVLIFRKNPGYEPAQVEQLLGAVNLSEAVHKTPLQASEINGNLMLTDSEKERQTTGGTWTELFPPDSLLNQHTWLAALTWYLVIALLGLMAFPLARFFLKGLPDKGYAFSRLIGLLLLAYFTWLAGSVGISFNRLTISIVFLLLLIISGVAAYTQRKELGREIRENWKTFLTIEVVVLLFFLVDLFIRIGNPDLWHPWKGGEKPMDLSYFTAVLKSTTFPPYDPWYSGGYINYYYYGYVIVGVPVKWLGIEPAVAYNLVVPTLFALTGIGAFSIGWNLHSKNGMAKHAGREQRGLLAGVAASLAVLIAGNLGTVKMLRQGLMRLGSPTGVIEDASFLESIRWFFSGLGKFISGTNLPYGWGEWYWNPSRAIPGDVITEFPFFTFTYADLHAHMIALPITLLVLGWALSILLRNWETGVKGFFRGRGGLICSILFGAFVIATLRPTNTWDLPTYLLFGAIALFYVIYRYIPPPDILLRHQPDWLRRMLYAAMGVALLVLCSSLFYLPFTEKYGQAYGSISAWKESTSPLRAYLVHWGWQFFLIISWFIWETREWLAATPVSALKKVKPYLPYIQVVGLLFLLVLVLLTALGIHIGWLVGIMGVWASALLLRPDQKDTKRLVLFMTGTGLLLTLFVELFALEGDIGRMNTVFKFYYQAWTLLNLSAAASLAWLMPAVSTRWRSGISSAWQVVTILLLAGAFLYPVTAGADKIRDRMSQSAPAGLDGEVYMQTSVYNDMGEDMDLNQDYQAIEWMRNNVQGSPVIVEANTVEYRWGNRFTINTGLPGVLGWNWHQRQQRGFLAYNGIASRLAEIPNFYQTIEINQALNFLNRYDVRYIILGQLEQLYYSGEGLDKFEMYDGVYWREVFRFEDTVIYEVVD